jgi:hypothetical protein
MENLTMTEKTCSEFLKEMADAGFDFKFRATSGTDVYVGEAKEGAIKAKKQATPQEAMQRIKARLSHHEK